VYHRDCAPEGAREWWGIVSREHWTPDMQVRAERVGVHPHGDDAGGVVLRWLAADYDDAVRRIHDTLGVDRIHFESGYPEAGLTPRGRSRNGRPRAAVERAGGLRCCGA
jgi:hypothetical protein